MERYFEALHKIGVTNDGQGLDYFIASDEEVTKDDLPFSHVLGFIACSIGGAHETKKCQLKNGKLFAKPSIIL